MLKRPWPRRRLDGCLFRDADVALHMSSPTSESPCVADSQPRGLWFRSRKRGCEGSRVIGATWNASAGERNDALRNCFPRSLFSDRQDLFGLFEHVMCTEPRNRASVLRVIYYGLALTIGYLTTGDDRLSHISLLRG